MNETTLLLIIAAGVNGLGAVIGAGALFWRISRAQDATIRRLQAEHDAKLKKQRDEYAAERKQSDEEHQRETSALRLRITALETTQATLIGLLQSRNLITPADAQSISSGASDPVYMALRKWFSLDELEAVARDAGMDVEQIGGDTVDVRAGRMVEYARNRVGLYDRLSRVVREARPGQVSA